MTAKSLMLEAAELFLFEKYDESEYNNHGHPTIFKEGKYVTWASLTLREEDFDPDAHGYAVYVYGKDFLYCTHAFPGSEL